MEPPEQRQPDRVEGLLRVTELQDEISALARKHRQIRVGHLMMPVILAGLVVGALGGASEWIWALVGGLVSLPVVLWQSRTHLRTIAEHKADLLLRLEEAKQPARLHARDDATVEPGSDAHTGM